VGADPEFVVLVEQLQVAGVGQGECRAQDGACEGRCVGEGEELGVEQDGGGAVDPPSCLSD
jgi:hypothetical protein